MANKKNLTSPFKLGCALIALICLSDSKTTDARTESTLGKITAENRSTYEIKFKRELQSLSGQTLQPPAGAKGFKGEKIIEPKSGVILLDSTPIEDINKEDIREFSVHLKDSNNNWNDLGRVYVGISCNQAVIGNISAANYTNRAVIDTFDNFICSQEGYDKIRGNQLAHPKELRTSWGYVWLPLQNLTATLTDNTTVTYNLYSGFPYDYSTSGFLFEVTATEAAKAGATCSIDNQPGEISAVDGKCHRLFCTTPDDYPGFKDIDGDCIPVGCSLESSNPEINGNPGLKDARGVCKPFKNLPCVLGDNSEGTTDATGLCTRKAGQTCTVPDSHGSKGITIAGGTCVGQADEPCMTKEGLGGVWSSDGKLCTPTASKSCILADGTTGTMSNDLICVKNKGETCINKEFNAEGIADGAGVCTPTVGVSCLSDGLHGTIIEKDGKKTCEPTGKTIGANQTCKDPTTSADGLMSSDGKCIPSEGARCLGDNDKEGIITAGKCSTTITTTSIQQQQAQAQQPAASTKSTKVTRKTTSKSRSTSTNSRRSSRRP